MLMLNISLKGDINAQHSQIKLYRAQFFRAKRAPVSTREHPRAPESTREQLVVTCTITATSVLIRHFLKVYPDFFPFWEIQTTQNVETVFFKQKVKHPL